MAESEEFERGHVAGQIAQRLAGHDEHFRRINGSIDLNIAAMEAVRLELVTLRLDAAAREERLTATALALASQTSERREALKAETEASDRVRERSWSPVGKALAVAAVIIAALGLVLAYVLHKV